MLNYARTVADKVGENERMMMGSREELIERALSSSENLSFDTDCSRSVQGTLRLMTSDIEAYTWNGTIIMNLRPYSLSASLCDRPFNVKDQKEWRGDNKASNPLYWHPHNHVRRGARHGTLPTKVKYSALSARNMTDATNKPLRKTLVNAFNVMCRRPSLGS